MKKGAMVLFFCIIFISSLFSTPSAQEDKWAVLFERDVSGFMHYSFYFQVGQGCKCQSYDEKKNENPVLVNFFLDHYRFRKVEICKADMYLYVGGASSDDVEAVNKEVLKILRSHPGWEKLYMVDKKKQKILAKGK